MMAAAAEAEAEASPGSDADVIERSRREPERFAVLFDRYGPQLHRYAARRLGDGEADDIVAETFLVAFRRPARRARRTDLRREVLPLPGLARRVDGSRRHPAPRHPHRERRHVQDRGRRRSPGGGVHVRTLLPGRIRRLTDRPARAAWLP
ncbi:RNA polymerase sigma factor [Spirillospora sp. NPDC048911]|uniref:RNA polymerase sigma factor n=1 Tax=Spirillospora sp. NPDC048911 TaxID=3364527 RepID=UPI0037116BAD